MPRPDINISKFTGFTAVKTGDARVRGGHTIVFDVALVNEGGHYDTKNGIFVCPHDGIYFVSVNMLVSGNIKLRLKRETKTVFYLHNEHRGNTVSSSGIIRCSKDDSIKLWVEYAIRSAVNNETIPFSTFTCMHLREPIGNSGKCLTICVTIH